MENSYMELFKQFCAARGIDKIECSFEDFEREFSGWLSEQKEIGNEYLSIIKNFNLFSGNSKCAEVNKGIEDSITLPFNTKLITPYIDDTSINESDRVIDGNLYINKIHIVPVLTSDTVKMMVIPREQIKTYMTQNPYSFNMLDGWDALHNSGRSDILVGVYGNVNDSDREKKIENLLQFKRRLNGLYREINYVINDKYFYVVGSAKNKSRQRIR